MTEHPREPSVLGPPSLRFGARPAVLRFPSFLAQNPSSDLRLRSSVFGSLFQRLRSKTMRMAAEHLARRPHRMMNRRPIISFTFDDFPVTALTVAGPMLERHGIAGTYYLSMGLTGTVAPTGPIIERADLSKVIERGHELGCHTFAHCHATDTSASVFERNIVENRDALRRILPTAKLKSLSYPIGCPRPATKRVCARHFAGARAGGQTFNYVTTDLDNLRAFFLEQSRDHLEAVLAVIDGTVRVGGWLILATHDVCPEPTRYGVVPEFFEAVVDHAVRSGADLLPVSRALERIGAVAPEGGGRKTEDGGRRAEDGGRKAEG